MLPPYRSRPPLEVPSAVTDAALVVPIPSPPDPDPERRPGPRPSVGETEVLRFVEELFGDDLHAKRVLSLAHGTLGVLHGTSLAIHAVGRGLAAARCGLDKHAVKQVDRLLSNRGIDLEQLGPSWVAMLLGERKEVFVNLDWTEFDKDDHTMLVASVQTNHGRSTPLLWRTWKKSELKGQRNDHEDELLRWLRRCVPAETRVTIVADRGFGDQKLFAFLNEELDFEYIIRFRQDTLVTDANGVSSKAREWMAGSGRLRRIKGGAITADKTRIPLIILVQDKGMKDAWCIASSRSKLSGRELKRLYGKRFSCEEMFRDFKDMRYGWGLSWTHIRSSKRRDRLFLLAAMAFVLLTLLGAAGEHAGLDKRLKTTTRPGRELSLYRQGLTWYERMPRLQEEILRPLLTAFTALLVRQATFREAFGVL
ncbi:MAG: IS4 family transposase [bacterium]|nr:IS4 family transposase [bacterium]